MSLRFIIISSFLLFVIASTLFTASRYKGENNVGVVGATDEEVRPKSLYVVAATAAAREKTLSGRKMVFDKTTTLHKIPKMNVMAREKHTAFRRMILSGNKNGKFVAFTEDYHSPRHHPPKNN
ncbi:hypothetical protein OSB04_008748 [Centaurea solstitialis]|uniref:Uncharacterized protein n=1 Tax=Centaurea solstitialis TaxID=347529 RepID=A0AA38U6X2_9ASTR|nr:hypothetical protein OSB04_008748 [Centaurea solstitialis]